LFFFQTRDFEDIRNIRAHESAPFLCYSTVHGLLCRDTNPATLGQ